MNNKKLNILQILPDLESGGVERGTLEIAEYLVKKGHNSYVVSSGGRLVNKLIEGGSVHFHLPIGKKSPVALLSIYKLLKIYKQYKIDIVHVRSRLPAWIVLLSFKFLSASQRPKFVTTIHGYNSISYYSSIMTKGDAVIIVSNALKKFILKNYDVDKSKIFLNYRGVPDLKNIKNRKNFLNWKLNWFNKNKHLKEKKILTLPTRISRRKGIEEFIDLISYLKGINFIVHGLIVGESKSIRYLRDLENKIKHLCLQQNITFLGYRSDIYEIMSISDIVFSLSSIPESFGRTVIESIKLGTPVIGLNHGGVGEQLSMIFPEGLVDLNVKNLLQKKTVNFIKKKPSVKRTNLFKLIDMQKNTLKIYKLILKKNIYDS